MKTILVSVNLTSQGDRAFERAAQLCREHSAALVIAAVLEDHSSAAERQEALRNLRSYKITDGLDPDYRLLTGHASREIAGLAARCGAELIVLGAHRERPLYDMFVETVAYSTIERCRLPVLIVKDRCVGPYKRVLVPTDFSSCAKRAFHMAMRLATQAEFHLTHVFETPFPAFIHLTEDELAVFKEERFAQIRADAEEELRSFARAQFRNTPPVHFSLERNSVDSGIFCKLRELDPDLLVMGLSGGDFAALIGGRTRSYILDPPCDMLVVS